MVAAPSELDLLEDLKCGVNHGQHDRVALHQPASVQGRSLRFSDFLSCRAQKMKVKTFVSGDFCISNVHCVQWVRSGGRR